MKSTRRRVLIQSLSAFIGGLLLRPWWAKGGNMKTVVYRADTRGVADHGWLKSHHTFSFASYHNPERMGFGLLRVINDDRVAPGMGFGTHPHRDMEIVSIPLSGALEHKDSQGNETVIRNGEVQLMSAGTGVTHSEYNHSKEEEVNFLQIWVLPEKLGISPRYDQKSFDIEKRRNQFQTVVSPLDKSEEGVKINQQAYFALADLDGDKSVEYPLRENGHGAYIFVLEGEVEVGGTVLQRRDALSLEDTNKFSVSAKKESKVLVIEVPMA